MALGAIFNPYVGGRFGPRPPAGVVGRAMSPAAASAAVPAAAPTTLPEALAAPAAEKTVMSIGPESDTLAKALLAQATQGGDLHSPFEAVGRLAQLWAGTAAEDKFQKAEKERAKAPFTALRDALAGGASIEDALSQSDDPSLLKLGLEYRMKRSAPQDAPNGYRWAKDGSGLEPIPGGPADKSATAQEPKIETFFDPKTGAEVKGIYDPNSPDGFRRVGGAKAGDQNKPMSVSPGSRIVDPSTGKEIYSAPEAAKAPEPFTLSEGQQRFDPEGNPIAGVPKQRDTYRDLITPEERAAKGISPEDHRPYQVDRDGKLLGPPGGTSVAVNTPFESQQDRTLGEGFGKQLLDIDKEGAASISALNSIAIIKNAMQDPNFYSGAGGTAVQALKQAYVAMGGDPSVAASTEAFNAQANKMVIDSMGGSLGTGFSNADRNFVVAQQPNLGNTPVGNKLLVDIAEKVAKRKIEIAALARQYKAAHGGKFDDGFYDELAQWAKANPLFPAAGASPPPLATPSANDPLGIR